MTERKKFTQVIKKGIVKTILWATVILILSLALVISALQLPYFQTKLVHKLTEVISGKTGFPVSIENANIKWLDKVLLEHVEIKDTRNNIMIGVKELTVDFQLYSLLDPENINIDEVILNQANINLIKNTDDQELNISLFIRNLKDLLSSDKTKEKKPVFSIDNIKLNNSRFSLSDPLKDSIFNKFDYTHFTVDSLQGKISEFRVIADTLEMEIEHLEGYDPASNLTISKFQTFYRLSKKAMEFNNLHLTANNSIIQDSVVFNYNSTAGLSYFNDSVTIAANFENTVIHSKDLALFALYFEQFEEYYSISGDFNGKVSKFRMNDFELAFGKNSKLKGNISFDGLPNIQETFIEGDLSSARLAPMDIRKYINRESYNRIQKFGVVDLKGRFIGFPNDFVANGTFLTNLGKIESDINLKIGENQNQSFYSGSLSTYNFDLGKLLEKPDLVQKINMSGHIKGSGFQLENADFNLAATISQFGFKHYEYKNIVTDARLAKEFFNGKISINDPNLKFTADATIDLRNNINKIDIKAELDTAVLKPLNLSKDEAFVSTFLDVDITGLELDSINGEARFRDTYILHQGRELLIDSLQIISKREKGNRFLKVNSDRLEMAAAGDYEYTKVISDLKRLIKEYRLNFLNQQKDIIAYYNNKDLNEYDKYHIDYTIKLNDINPYLNLLIPGLYVSQNTIMEGSFSGGYTSILSLNAKIDTLKYKKYNFYETDLDVTTSKIADSSNVLAMAYVFSERQKTEGLAETNDLLFEGIWQDDHIDFRSDLMVEAPHSYTKINGELEFLKNKIEIKFKDSDLHAIGNKWNISDDNKIQISNREVTFDNVKFFNGDQNILINGSLSDSTGKQLTIEVNSFQVNNLNPLLKNDFYGEINGYLEIENFYNNMLLESELAIYEFKIGKFLVGNISGVTNWDNQDNELDVNFEINRLAKKIMDLDGVFNPGNKEDQLDITAKFNQANINIIEPFIDEIFSEIAGVATGEFKISGKPDYPVLKGEGVIKEGKFKINYLNTKYSFDGNLVFDENEIGVRDVILIDENFNQAEINGGVFHDGFKNFVIDLSADMKNFQVLNTSRNDNNLYYGTANVTGDLNMLGSVSNLKFTSTATTNKGTKLFIPIGGSNGIDEQDYINFVNFSDSAHVVHLDSISNKIDLRGLSLDFDLDITPDAYAEIIFDIQSGDIIRGRGNGQINLLIDTQGDFNMFGDFEILRGGYNFTLYNIINKEFTIQRGSKISWYGDPYAGILDIDATYQQLASLQPLLISVDENAQLSPEMTRRYPAKVLLELQGPLLSPDIEFDIAIDDYPENAITPDGITLGSSVAAFKARIDSDKQERERQVFSLIILRQFSPENSFSTGGSFGNSVSELLSNQLSYWITQVDENLEIDVDLSGLDADAFNTFQLRLSYTFLEGRLRITRAGGFTDVRNEADFQSVFGEWTLEYFLTPDGKFRVKVFNENNYNTLDGLDDANAGFTGGFSLIHVTSFDNFKELISDFRKGKKEESQEPKEEVIPTDSGITEKEDEGTPPGKDKEGKASKGKDTVLKDN